jgi:hypothetical protein
VTAERHGNALLDTAASLAAAIMARRGLALARPVAARFETSERGSTGIELAVKLADPRRKREAADAIREHFGLDADGVDAVRVT